MFTIRPQPAARMSGTKARTVWNRASTLSVKTARQSSKLMLLEGLVRVDAGVVDQNGRGPEPAGDLLLGGDHGRGVGEVGAHGDRRATALLHLRDHVGGVGAIQHRDRGALACQPQRVGPADPARPAGDDGDPAVVAAGHDATSWGAGLGPDALEQRRQVDVDPQRGDQAVRGAVEERHARQRDLGAALGGVVQERFEHGGPAVVDEPEVAPLVAQAADHRPEAADGLTDGLLAHGGREVGEPDFGVVGVPVDEGLQAHSVDVGVVVGDPVGHRCLPGRCGGHGVRAASPRTTRRTASSVEATAWR